MIEPLGLRLRGEITQRIDDIFELGARIVVARDQVGAIFAEAVIREPGGQDGPLLVRGEIGIIEYIQGMLKSAGRMQELRQLQWRCVLICPGFRRPE
ncbi:hypothetical protein L6654_39945 [Bradyrhizobium sp. WYCCWR 13023]|uniref:Uncharacterized protein n=1 Tax=Bradyrhizobium zhengyangense TaxID=2911009 RepID=A0A9X1UF87_9BRAD|nr:MULTISPECIES: hypothetical protein [Bradyrhizobium]MCG2632773.1 hypothetical protein [Bradyrhizobium zhengyangense]MCG2671754.1 hypothetical protein [Bradyrhizobium zhengyangense]MDA9521975.1 hypothetical protein [Bradyrhizobium sp. CCBAU 11434]